jgi:hypothetical protein
MFFKKIQFFTLLHFSASILHGSQDHEHDAVLKQILRAHRQYQQMIAQNPILEDKELTPEDADIFNKLRLGGSEYNLKNETELLLNPDNHWLVNQHDDPFQNFTPLKMTTSNYRCHHSMIKSPRSFKMHIFSAQIFKLYTLMLLAAGANPDQKPSICPIDTTRNRAPELIAECEKKLEILKQEIKQDEENEKLAVAALLTQS